MIGMALVILFLAVSFAAEIGYQSAQLPSLILRYGDKPVTKFEKAFARSCMKLSWKVGGIYEVTKLSFAVIMLDVVIANLIDLLIAF